MDFKGESNGAFMDFKGGESDGKLMNFNGK